MDYSLFTDRKKSYPPIPYTDLSDNNAHVRASMKPHWGRGTFLG